MWAFFVTQFREDQDLLELECRTLTGWGWAWLLDVGGAAGVSYFPAICWDTWAAVYFLCSIQLKSPVEFSGNEED